MSGVSMPQNVQRKVSCCFIFLCSYSNNVQVHVNSDFEWTSSDGSLFELDELLGEGYV